METHGRARRCGLIAAVGAASLTLGALGPGLAEGAKKGGNPKGKTATLSVQAPSGAKVGTPYNIGASGYSGKFNRLLIVGSKVKCPKNAQQAYETFFGVNTQTVKKQHNFNRTEPFTASTSGKRWACVYLFDKDHTGGKQKHKSKTFTVSK